MARGTSVQYIQFYTDGSAARKAAPVVPLQTAALPNVKKRKKIIIRVDPVAVLGIVVAVLMLCLMIGGITELRAAQEQTAAMEQYVSELQQENKSLQAEYSAGYDIEEVERMARAIGMVPAEQVTKVPVRLSAPPQPQTESLGFWDSITTFLAGLFA